jgi:hypothetical protein
MLWLLALLTQQQHPQGLPTHIGQVSWPHSAVQQATQPDTHLDAHLAEL